jgi:hypothetical protein
MASQGPFLPDVAIDLGSSWSDEANIKLADTNIAEVLNLAPSNSSSWLATTDYGFSIPGTATIDGILVETEDATPVPSSFGDIQMTKDGTNPVGTLQNTNTGSWADVNGSSSTYLWGTTWTPAEINDVDFGVLIRISNGEAFFINESIDALRVTVYYTELGQTVYPDADTDASTWTTAPLWSKVDEPDTPSDADFITATAT